MTRMTAPLILAIASVAVAGPSISYIEQGNLASSLSYDGTVAAGNCISDQTYETFRWTQTDGLQRLGLASFQVIFRAAGTPDVSYNGRRVSASILSSDYQLTQGLWDVSSGWTETMPPPPADGALVDDGYGSAWGLSGNGQVVTGFFWSPSYRAQASVWSAGSGVVALGQAPGVSARANACNYDGSVVGGWEEAEWGSWMPRAWRNGVKYELSNLDGGVNQVETVNGSGDVLGGSSRDDSLAINVATLWRWNGTSYDTQILGALPNYFPEQTTASILGISDDASIAVGVHVEAWGSTEGIVWTPEDGLQRAADFFAARGVVLPEGYLILDCADVSADASTIVCTMLDPETSDILSAVIRLRQPCPGDLNLDGQVDDSDFVLFASQYDVLDCGDPAMPGYCRADVNNDGLVEDADFVEFAQGYDQLVCP